MWWFALAVILRSRADCVFTRGFVYCVENCGK